MGLPIHLDLVAYSPARPTVPKRGQVNSQAEAIAWVPTEATCTSGRAIK